MELLVWHRQQGNCEKHQAKFTARFRMQKDVNGTSTCILSPNAWNAILEVIKLLTVE